MIALLNKIREVSFINFTRGVFIYFRNYIFMKIFQYDSWHLSTMYFRPYLKFVVDYLNGQQNKRIIVDVGCGNGELLRNLKDDVSSFGFDLSTEIINYANFLNSKKNTSFHVGTLSNIKIDKQKIDYFILLNWTHSMSYDDFKRELNIFLDRYEVSNIIIDYVPDYRNHSIEHITSNQFIESFRRGGFLRNREIVIYSKVEK